MTVLDGLLQGIIQGLTEFLPVSSSGHLSLYQYFTGNAGEGSLFFSLMLHLGTLAAVIAAYYQDLWKMLVEVGRIFTELVRGRFTLKTDNPSRKLLFMLFFACLPMLFVIPINGLVAKISGDKDIVVEGVCFLVTAGLLFLGCKAPAGRAGVLKMRPKHAVTVGIAQAVAVLPGISRSGATISTQLVLGFDRAFAVKFSFLLGIPAILGGVVFEIGDAAKAGLDVPLLPLFVGMLAAALVGYVSIRLIRWLVLSDKFIIFAWYTLALGVLVIILGVIGHITGGGAPDASGASSMISTVSGAISGG
ncbi:undecaprenyl-diphosphate phosphatase [Ruminococcaceae bacterium OttesenSCG-928-O06]|nr:undecaprenyl-diphosphate phosphatase [Ruminococcaceae bacterium OttesenSCG-928-O06]